MTDTNIFILTLGIIVAEYVLFFGIVPVLIPYLAGGGQ